MTALITLGLVALSAGGLAVAGAILLCRKPVYGYYAATAVLLTLWEAPNLPAIVQVAGIQIYPVDAIAVIFLVAAAGRFPERREHGGTISRLPHRAHLMLGLVLAALLTSFVSGLVLTTLGRAVNEFRGYFYIAAFLIFAARSRRAVDPDQLLASWSRGTGSAMVVVATVHVMLHGLGAANSFVEVAGVTQTGRPLVATQALVLALCTLHQFDRCLRDGRGIDWCITAVFAGVMVVAQHRSVWIAFAVGILVIAWQARAAARARVAVVGVVVLYAFLLTWLSTGFEFATEYTEKSVYDTGTYEDRENTWGTLIDESVEDGALTAVFGSPMGSGWDRVDAGGVVRSYTPHNWYVILYLRIGLLGLLLYLAATVSVLIALRRHAVGLAIWLAVAIYAWAYGLSWFVAPLMVLTSLAACRPAPPDRRPDIEPHTARSPSFDLEPR